MSENRNLAPDDARGFRLRFPDLCPDCGHHTHRPRPERCQWHDCPCDTVPRETQTARLREALNYALNQWALYADADRGEGRHFDYIADSNDGGDAEAEQFRSCRTALRGGAS